jgi:hypothetical protein
MIGDLTNFGKNTPAPKTIALLILSSNVNIEDTFLAMIDPATTPSTSVNIPLLAVAPILRDLRRVTPDFFLRLAIFFFS